MTRAISIPASHKRKRKRVKMAKGYYGGRSKLYRSATEAVNRALAYSWRDRKAKKRTFRSLWIIRINAACRAHEISYNRFIEGLNNANVELDRKILAELALDHSEAFSKLIELAKETLAKKKKKKNIKKT